MAWQAALRMECIKGTQGNVHLQLRLSREELSAQRSGLGLCNHLVWVVAEKRTVDWDVQNCGLYKSKGQEESANGPGN